MPVIIFFVFFGQFIENLNLTLLKGLQILGIGGFED
jgi:hypothetical protein